MSLYLGSSEKLKIGLNKENRRVELKDIVNNTKLSSADDYILKDSFGVYMTVKESE